MTVKEFEAALLQLLTEEHETQGGRYLPMTLYPQGYHEVGMLTHDAGVVVYVGREEFRLTIHKRVW